MQRQDIESIHEVRCEQNSWLGREETMWHQRSKNCWYKAGDRNTKFFHAKALSRKQRNSIEGLLYSNEVWQDDEDKTTDMFLNYYSDLFKSLNPDNFDLLLEAVSPKVTLAMNANLIKDFNAVEVKQPINQMHPLKAPGPDGLPPLLMQNGLQWPFVQGKEVLVEIKEVLVEIIWAIESKSHEIWQAEVK